MEVVLSKLFGWPPCPSVSTVHRRTFLEQRPLFLSTSIVFNLTMVCDHFASFHSFLWYFHRVHRTINYMMCKICSSEPTLSNSNVLFNIKVPNSMSVDIGTLFYRLLAFGDRMVSTYAQTSGHDHWV